MKRDWDIIRAILEHIEADDMAEYIRSGDYLRDTEDSDIFLGHIELLIDARLLEHCEVIRGKSGKFEFWNFRGAHMTMRGHDLLAALRDKTVWNKIRNRAQQLGVSLSWEFVKQAIPRVIEGLLNG